MKTTYCLFEISQHLGAINTAYLEEVIALPELILIPNAPSGIIGVIDLRGDVLPIVDLRLSIKDQSPPYLLTDSIIILKQADLRIGLMVNNVEEIKELTTQGMVAEISGHQSWMSPDVTSFFDGIVLNETEFFILSAPQLWFNPGELQQVISITRFLIDDFYESQTESSARALREKNVPFFASNASSQEQKIFHQRAENLRRTLDDNQTVIDSKTLIVLALHNNLVGIDATYVQEFITINQATPIPCCPRHIIGSTNLRGDVLTIIDISGSLGFSSKSLARNPKAVVIELENILAAIIVEDVRDAMFEVNVNNIQRESTLSRQYSYVQGEVPYGDQQMYILDLPGLFHSDGLSVNEAF
ncbi:MAG: chemotaxis protein CheW [Cyanobacteria bacterium P01_B01_bin.77]